MADLKDDPLYPLLKDEYFHLQKVIEDFDSRIVTIKAWSITFSLVALGTAFSTGAKSILLVSCISALLFWFLEASWKTFQLAYYPRINCIETYFRGGKTVCPHPYQISGEWGRSFKTGGVSRLKRVLLWPHVALPHVVVALLALGLFLLAHFHVIIISK